METLSISNTKSTTHFYALIKYEDPYVQPLILSALVTQLPKNSYTLISSTSELPSPDTPFLQITSYETLPFSEALAQPTTTLLNAYTIRKALIRKHYLSTTVQTWLSKNPSSILCTAFKTSCDFELDYAEFLDDAILEAWELHQSFENNEGKSEADREWWILKPGMSDRGQGIRLFSSMDELQAIFDEWEVDSDEEDETGDGIVTSNLRHFVAQPYVHPPLLLDGNPHKWHIRTYVLASGALNVFVYKQMLALFASSPYTAPSTTTPLSAHLTNTCLQPSVSDGTVQAFWSLALPDELKESIWKQICSITGEIFEAAARGMGIHFQTVPNAFEVFGVDFLVDAQGGVYLLEVNAFPDFGQTGGELRSIVGGVWEGVVNRVIKQFFGLETEAEGEQEKGDMVRVRRVEMGR